MTVLEEPTTVTVATFTGPDAQAFGRIISNIGKAVQTGGHSPTLEHVLMRRDGDMLVFQATDQYRAVTVSFRPLFGSLLVGHDPVLLEGKQLVKAGKLVGRKTQSVTVTLDRADVRIETAEGLVIVPTLLTPWPNVEQVRENARVRRFPIANSEEEMECPVNGLMLADMLAIMGKIIGTPDPRICLTGTGVIDNGSGRGPWRWVTDEKNDLSVEGIIMGMRK